MVSAQTQISTDSSGRIITIKTAAPVTTTPILTPVYPPGYYPRRFHHYWINIYKVRFGVFIAPDISYMKPTATMDDRQEFKTENKGPRLGFNYGLMADYWFEDNYALVSGLSINTTGGKINATAIDQTPGVDKVKQADFTYHLQYIDLPIALKMRTDSNRNKFRFFGQIGLSVGVNISKKVDYEVAYYDDNSMSQTATGTKIKLNGALSEIAPIMFQMNIGAGFEYSLNDKLKAYLGVFFNNGFFPDATKPDQFDNTKLGYVGTFRDGTTRLNNFALRLGLLF